MNIHSIMNQILDDTCNIQIRDKNGNLLMNFSAEAQNISVYSDINSPFIGRFKIDGFVVNEKPKTVKVPTCNHSWKVYTGFTDSYEYCDVCGVKK